MRELCPPGVGLDRSAAVHASVVAQDRDGSEWFIGVIRDHRPAGCFADVESIVDTVPLTSVGSLAESASLQPSMSPSATMLQCQPSHHSI